MPEVEEKGGGVAGRKGRQSRLETEKGRERGGERELMIQEGPGQGNGPDCSAELIFQAIAIFHYSCTFQTIKSFFRVCVCVCAYSVFVGAFLHIEMYRYISSGGGMSMTRRRQRQRKSNVSGVRTKELLRRLQEAWVC